MCKKCARPITQTLITRTTACEFCGADLHSCVNCKFYSPGDHYDCHETIDELVKDKENANFCEYYSPNKKGFSAAENSEQNQNKKAQAAKKAFEDLFSI